MLATEHTTEMLLRSRHTHYEHGDKASKLLACQLWQISSSHQIPQIQTSTGLTIDLKKISEELKEFYSSLYTSENMADNSHSNSFFDSLDISTVHPDLVSNLEKDIMTDEINIAFTSMQSGKYPELDGTLPSFTRSLCTN